MGKNIVKLPTSYPEPGKEFTVKVVKTVIKADKIFIIGTVNGSKTMIVHSKNLAKLFKWKKIIKFTGVIKDGCCYFPRIGVIKPKVIANLDTFPESLREDFDRIYNCKDINQTMKSWNRLLHYELAVMRSLMHVSNTNKIPQLNCTPTKLPFTLSDEQKKAWDEIKSDLQSPVTTNRLVYGEVGSGKSLLIFLAMEHSVLNGRKVAILVPNRLLAKQLYDKFTKWNNKLEIELVLGSTSSQDLSKSVLIGTQALFFKALTNIDLLIIDEQHKFGVNQRQLLRGSNCDLLMTTATPIPRTLAMLSQGYMSVSYLKKRWGKIKSYVISYNSYEDLVERVVKKSQSSLILWVVNRVEKAQLFAEKMQKRTNIVLIHGKCTDKDEKFSYINTLTSGLVISTTVLEIGIDCNFNIVIIENAESFGLAQIHQIRGRVARKAGSEGYCILLGDDIVRLKEIKNADDAFKISNLDFQRRGGSNVLSKNQSGINCNFAKILNTNRSLESRQVTIQDVIASKKIKPSLEIIRFFSDFSGIFY